MELISFSGGTAKRLRRQRGAYNYTKISTTKKRSRNTRIARFGASKWQWRLRLAPRLRLLRLSSPHKLWNKFKNGYMKTMLRLANFTHSDAGASAFGQGRIPKARDPTEAKYTQTEFENRLVLEIYKSMVSSLELGYIK